MTTVLLCFGLLVCFLVLELSVRRYGVSPEITRRFAHVFAGLFAVVMYLTTPGFIYLSCVVIFGCAVLISYGKNYFTSIHRVRRRTYGELFLPLGLLAAYLIAGGETSVYIPAVLVLTLADPLGGVMSDIRRLHRSTVTGSLVFFVVTVIILISMTIHMPLWIIAISAIVTVVERISKVGSDNLTIPVAVAVLLLF